MTPISDQDEIDYGKPPRVASRDVFSPGGRTGSCSDPRRNRNRSWSITASKGSSERRRVQTPSLSFELHFQNSAQAGLALRDKSVEEAIGDRGVRYSAASFVEGYEKSKYLITLASSERVSLLTRLLEQSPDGQKPG